MSYNKITAEAARMLMADMNTTVKRYIVELCRERMDFTNTGLLCDGLIRKLVSTIRPVAGSYSQEVVIGTIEREAVRFVIETAAAATSTNAMGDD